MGNLITLALLVAEGVSGRKGRQTATHVARIAVFTLAAACCGFSAFACALVALWLYVVPQVGPAGAPLVVAGVLLVMCLVLLAVVQFGLKPRPPPASGFAASELITEATRLLNEHKGTVLLAALLAGLVAGRREK